MSGSIDEVVHTGLLEVAEWLWPFVLGGAVGYVSFEIGWRFAKWRGWPHEGRMRAAMVAGMLGILALVISPLFGIL